MSEFIERIRFGETLVHHDEELFVSWAPGLDTVDLNGGFLSTELREIADWMDAHQPKGENKS